MGRKRSISPPPKSPTLGGGGKKALDCMQTGQIYRLYRRANVVVKLVLMTYRRSTLKAVLQFTGARGDIFKINAKFAVVSILGLSLRTTQAAEPF